jgi:preprotein translocase subunit SecF
MEQTEPEKQPEAQQLAEKAPEKPARKFSIKEVYDKQYKKLILFTLILLVLALGQIAYQIATTGDFINKGVSLKGGLTLSINKAENINELFSYLSSQYPKADLSVRELSKAGTQFGVIIEASDIDADTLVADLKEKLKLKEGEYSVEIMGSSLGASFFQETLKALIFAFVFMGIAVFAYFRIPIPSFAVILCAFSDIIGTIAITNMMGMKISTAGIAAFLMLIGYSVDTDILLTTRVLRRKPGISVMDATIEAMKTGFMMNVTALCAVIITLLLTQSDVIKQIMIILLVGLLVDLIFTWVQNAGILRLYFERREARKHGQA